MDESLTVQKITAMINRAISRRILDRLKEIGVLEIHLAPARGSVILESRGLFGFGAQERLIDTPMDIITFSVPPEAAEAILNLVIDWGELNLHGRGSVYCEEITIPAAHEVFSPPGAVQAEPGAASRTLPSLQTVCCIVQRGQGTAIARVALDSGAGVPVIYNGSGSGIRDKMGLLRIAIPAEKEIVVVGTTPHNYESVMDMMIDIGRLGEPGRGFIYTYPVRSGWTDLQVSRGGRRHAASMEQIVAAIDRMRGDTVWRRWATGGGTGRIKKRRYLTGVVDLTLMCNAGKGPELVKAAMEAGAPGATISSYRYLRPPDSPLSVVPMARDACSMVLPADLVPQVVEAVRAAGGFSDRCLGRVQVRRIEKAFTCMPVE